MNDDRGRQADGPSEIPARGWKDVAARVRQQVTEDGVVLMAAGVAFWALMALVPALVALISVYGLVADPANVRSQINSALGAAPREVRELVASQLQSIVANSAGKVGIGLAVGIALALWSASSGVSHLIEAINRAYDESETRGFVRRKAVALGFTVVAVVFVVGAVFVITSLPAVVQHLPGTVRSTIGIARWVILLGGMVVGLSVLYRYGPDRDSPKWRWASAGAIVAALLWVAASALFAVYTANFASYNQTYGSLGAVVVLLLWLFITAFAVIVGAELNCELERQTVVDSTVGQPRPMGSRRALAADTVGPTADELHEQSAGIEEHRFTARAADVRAGVAPTVGVGPTVDHRTKRWATIIGLIAVAAAAVTGRIGGETTSREGK